MTYRYIMSLSDAEASSLTTLAAEGQDVLATEDAYAVLGEEPATRDALDRPVEKGWLERIEKGKYLAEAVARRSRRCRRPAGSTSERKSRGSGSSTTSRGSPNAEPTTSARSSRRLGPSVDPERRSNGGAPPRFCTWGCRAPPIDGATSYGPSVLRLGTPSRVPRLPEQKDRGIPVARICWITHKGGPCPLGMAAGAERSSRVRRTP
jgi:hypothetical protein